MGIGRTEEFRSEAVRIALTSGLSHKQVAADLGIGLSTLGFVTLTGFTPNLGKLSMAAIRNVNGLASWRHTENSLQSLNVTMPCCFLVPPGLNQDIQHLTLAVHRPPIDTSVFR